VDGALSLIHDSAVNEELLVLECLDTVLEADFLGIALDGGGNLFPKKSGLEKVQ